MYRLIDAVVDSVTDALATLVSEIDGFEQTIVRRPRVLRDDFNWLTNHIGSAWTFFGLGVGGLLISCLLIVLWLRRTGLLDRSPAKLR